MRVSRCLLHAVCALALLGTPPTDASAYCLKLVKANTVFVAWTPLPVTYRLSDNLTDPKLIDAIDASFKAWSSVPCSTLKFTKGQPFKQCLTKPCAAGTVDPDHATPYLYVFWVTEPWDSFKEDPKNPATVVYPSYSFLWQNNIGGIVGATIAINAKDYTFLPDGSTGCSGKTFDMQDFMMPTIGGVSGLTDSDTSASVMTPLKFCSTSHRTLTQDDKDALIFLYKESAACTGPKASAASGCSGGSTPTGDGKKDLGPVPKTEGGVTPGKDGTTPGKKDGGTQPRTEAGLPIGGDGINLPPKDDDSGCCRVSHASSGAGDWLVLLGGALIALALLRRRR